MTSLILNLGLLFFNKGNGSPQALSARVINVVLEPDIKSQSVTVCHLTRIIFVLVNNPGEPIRPTESSIGFNDVTSILYKFPKVLIGSITNDQVVSPGIAPVPGTGYAISKEPGT